MDWYQFKIALTEATGVSQDALHILVGVGIQLLLGAVLRRGVSSVLPWIIVLVLEMGNEWSDLQLEVWPDRPQQWGQSIKDLLVTMAVPTTMLVLARWAPGLLVGSQRGDFGNKAGNLKDVAPDRP